MYDSAYVRVYNLDSAHRSVSLRERIIVPTSQVRIENITFNSVDSIYFVYSLSDKTKRMAYYGNKGLAEVAVNSNILRNTDNRLYVGTDSGLRAYNTDGTYTTMANMVNYHPIFIATPIVINPEVLLAKVTINQQQTGKKVYELKDHLGNVRATITDRKFLTGIDIPAYQAEPVTATDYYAFGSPQFGRKYTSDGGSYLFGFNTQEKVDEVSGEGNHNTAEYWEYDTRLGRRWNLDPVVKEWESPYACFANNPILLVDKDGADTSFTDADAKKGFDEAHKDVLKEMKDNQDEIDKLKQKGLKKGWTKEKLASKTKKYENRIASLKLIKNDFDYICDPNTKRVEYSTDMSKFTQKGERIQTMGHADVTVNSSGDVISAKIYFKRKSSVIHENRHTRQNYHKISLFQREVEAFQFQRIFSAEDVQETIDIERKLHYPDPDFQPKKYDIEEMVKDLYQIGK